MFRNKSVDVHRFSMIPKADIPRSKFKIEKTHKTTFDSGYLIPIYCEEVLPGDSFRCNMTAFARLATPIFPIMDNLYMDSFFFFVPNRLVWSNWQKFMGQQQNPDDSIDYTIPQISSPAGGYAVNSIFDYFGLPTAGQITGANKVTHSCLPLRAYNLCFNEWFRDENLVDSLPQHNDDGPDPATDYALVRRGKRHDYFTSCLPWPQKGPAITVPLGTQAPITVPTPTTGSPAVNVLDLDGTTRSLSISALTNPLTVQPGGPVGGVTLFADLSEATASTINQLRMSFQIQKLLERDARGGTRYTEVVRAHFGVASPDARLQRPEFLGGGTTPVRINPVQQTSATGNAGTDTPLGTLAAIGTAVKMNNGFSQSFTEHGHVLGLIAVRADLNYQQGLRKMWSRKTRFDFYFPVFASLGEQAVLNKEIYVTGTPQDEEVFGYNERWSEYRYSPSMITGLFRSTSQGTIDGWHLAQHFTSLPTLNTTFIQDTPPVARIVAVGDQAEGQQFLFDSVFSTECTRPMPIYSVPGLIDHF